MSNDCPFYDEVQFCYFKIEIFSKGRLIYRKKTSYKKEKRYFKPNEILQDLEKLYDPVISENPYEEFDSELPFQPMTFLLISPSTMKWKWEYESHKNSHIDDMCGIVLYHSKTITFLNIDDLKLLESNVRGMQSQTVLFSPSLHNSEEVYNLYNDDEPLHGSMRLIDIWAMNLSDVIEYTVYLPYVYMVLKTISEVNDFGKITNLYQVESRVYIEYQGSDEYSKEIDCNEESILGIMDIVKLFY
jgi:hypothetical protein